MFLQIVSCEQHSKRVFIFIKNNYENVIRSHEDDTKFKTEETENPKYRKMEN